MHTAVDLAIHYWGTPVVLISTRNEDGTANVAPMSSAWWLGWSCMLGLDASSQTVINLRREQQCVLNLCDAGNAEAVNRLALLTGRKAVPLHKRALGYRYEPDKLQAAGLTGDAGDLVAALRLSACPVQLEAAVQSVTPFAAQDPRMAIAACAVELRILRAHVRDELLTGTHRDRIDATAWRPLLMSFRHLFELGPSVGDSKLAAGPEQAYAPWKGSAGQALAGRALRAWSQWAHGVPASRGKPEPEAS
jgi:flavin reductase (DIM6/NTAB) family NADH-FMN oxidoreductase RutF